MIIYNIFYVSLLKLTKQPLFKQVNKASEVILMNEKKEYEIQIIVNLEKCDNKFVY